jgi:hypothetical protein
MYEPDELVRLAEAYAAAKGRALSTISIKIFGRSHDKLFTRLRAGCGCNTTTAQQASRWFDQHWPEDLPWPLAAPRNTDAVV